MKIVVGVRQSSDNTFELVIRMPQVKAKNIKKVFEIEGEITSSDDLKKLKAQIKEGTRKRGIKHVDGL